MFVEHLDESTGLFTSVRSTRAALESEEGEDEEGEGLGWEGGGWLGLD